MVGGGESVYDTRDLTAGFAKHQNLGLRRGSVPRRPILIPRPDMKTRGKMPPWSFDEIFNFFSLLQAFASENSGPGKRGHISLAP